MSNDNPVDKINNAYADYIIKFTDLEQNKKYTSNANKYANILKKSNTDYSKLDYTDVKDNDNSIYEWFNGFYLIMISDDDSIVFKCKGWTAHSLHGAAVAYHIKNDADSEYDLKDFNEILNDDNLTTYSLFKLAIDIDNGYPIEYIKQDILTTITNE